MKIDFIGQFGEENEEINGKQAEEDVRKQILKLKLDNERYEILVEDKQTQIDIINKFLDELI